ncbi:hypothetical protein JCM11641_007348 [Rhodosporidiobolus odoratus]
MASAKLASSASASKPTADALTDDWEMQPDEMAPIAKAQVEMAVEQEERAQAEEEESERTPKERQTKAEKAYNKRKALLEKLAASTTPYSKSHARRLRRNQKPENNLVASLEEVTAMLPVVEPLPTLADDEDAEEMEDEVEGGKRKDGKGREKLTAKKRQRVLCVLPFKFISPSPLPFDQFSEAQGWRLTLDPSRPNSTAESARLPAIIKNESFAASPFATIRQHTLNTLVTQKNPPLPQKGKGKKGGK